MDGEVEVRAVSGVGGTGVPSIPPALTLAVRTRAGEAGERREATPRLGPGCGWKRSRCLGSPDSPGEQGPR